MVSIKNKDACLRWAPILIVAFTLVFRLILLGIKPPHFDEGVNGWFLDQMAHDGYYNYDPANYHGPLHFYLLFIFKVLLGRSVWALRLPIVMVSTATVWLVTRFDRFMDRRACWLAALAMAVSPGAEFYGRYAIHESEMVFFIILLVWGVVGLRRSWTMQYLWATGIGIAGMILTKETYVIHFTAFFLAWLCLLGLEYFLPSAVEPPPVASLPPAAPVTDRGLLLVSAISVALIIFFYSGTFLDIPALKGLYLTFGEWAKTGQAGNGHEKPEYDIVLWTLKSHAITVNYYWLALIARYEWPALVGMCVSLFYISPVKTRFIRYLLIYAWGAVAAYSIVRYKTPWCIITIIWPFFFVFGHFCSRFLDGEYAKITWTYAILILAGSFTASARLSFWHYTDETEPYVYVQTFEDINKLTDPLFKLVAEDRANYHLKGHIILESYHPLPWVLGDFTNVGYYDDKNAPDVMDADFLLVDKSRVAEIEKGLKGNYFVDSLQLRSSMDPARLFFNVEKFQHLWPDRKPDFVQGKAVTEPAETGDDQ